MKNFFKTDSKKVSLMVSRAVLLTMLVFAVMLFVRFNRLEDLFEDYAGNPEGLYNYIYDSDNSAFTDMFIALEYLKKSGYLFDGYSAIKHYRVDDKLTESDVQKKLDYVIDILPDLDVVAKTVEKKALAMNEWQRNSIHEPHYYSVKSIMGDYVELLFSNGDIDKGIDILEKGYALEVMRVNFFMDMPGIGNYSSDDINIGLPWIFPERFVKRNEYNMSEEQKERLLDIVGEAENMIPEGTEILKVYRAYLNIGKENDFEKGPLFYTIADLILGHTFAEDSIFTKGIEMIKAGEEPDVIREKLRKIEEDNDLLTGYAYTVYTVALNMQRKGQGAYR